MDLSCFSNTYAEARQKFLQACHNSGLVVESHIHPLLGSEGEELALDVALFGSSNARHLLVISSGVHGVEGFCGSAVQIDHLRNQAWLNACHHDNIAVLFLHAINPYGFSWLRRVNEDNIDLNRNFINFNEPLPDNVEYQSIAHLLVPKRKPPTFFSTLGLLRYALKNGMKSLQAAISQGQHTDAKGLFYSGIGPAWSNTKVRQIMQNLGQECWHIAWIDVHTGLGPRGVGELIYKGHKRPEDIARARRWWGPDVTSSLEGNSSSAVLNGTLDSAILEECSQAEYTGLTLEYGTKPGPVVLKTLCADQWLENNPQTGKSQRYTIKRQLREAFYIEEDDWKTAVLEQARQVTENARLGLTDEKSFAS